MKGLLVKFPQQLRSRGIFFLPRDFMKVARLSLRNPSATIYRPSFSEQPACVVAWLIRSRVLLLCRPQTGSLNRVPLLPRCRVCGDKSPAVWSPTARAAPARRCVSAGDGSRACTAEALKGYRLISLQHRLRPAEPATARRVRRGQSAGAGGEGAWERGGAVSVSLYSPASGS